MAATAGNERRRVIYSGRVQGVGFRYTACRIAEDYAVTGYVRNLRNGTVELVAEGQPEVLDRFLAEVARTMGDYIAHAETHRLPATGQFRSFGVSS